MDGIRSETSGLECPLLVGEFEELQPLERLRLASRVLGVDMVAKMPLQRVVIVVTQPP